MSSRAVSHPHWQAVMDWKEVLTRHCSGDSSSHELGLSTRQGWLTKAWSSIWVLEGRSGSFIDSKCWQEWQAVMVCWCRICCEFWYLQSHWWRFDDGQWIHDHNQHGSEIEHEDFDRGQVSGSRWLHVTDFMASSIFDGPNVSSRMEHHLSRYCKFSCVGKNE